MSFGAPARSLKARALQLLAQREHSRVELRRKLMAHVDRAARRARDDAAASAARPDGSGLTAPGTGASRRMARANQTAPHADVDTGVVVEDANPTAAIDDLLDWLEAKQFLSTERFVESRVHARATRFGNLRIRQELARHEVALDADQMLRLRDSELDRARAVWERKFGGAAAAGPAGRARQARFLAGRGFSGEVIARLLRDARPACAGDGPSEDD